MVSVFGSWWLDRLCVGVYLCLIVGKGGRLMCSWLMVFFIGIVVVLLCVVSSWLSRVFCVLFCL